MKRIYRHYRNHWMFELVAEVPAAQVSTEIAKREAEDATLRTAGWQFGEVYYRVA